MNSEEALCSDSAMGAVENIGESKPPRGDEPFVDATTAGTFLHLRPRRVLELARQGVLPAYPLGDGKRRVWRFRLSELDSAMHARGVNSSRQSPAPGQETS